jgi:CPA2 family monovalent cation:H+ antiporter-2
VVQVLCSDFLSYTHDQRSFTQAKFGMPHETALIATLAIGLALAFVGAFIAVRLRLSPIVGYLLAGTAVGPFTLGFVADAELAQQLAEIGVILLLVGVSYALGAFFAGVVINESGVSRRAASDLKPLEDIFAVLFFVSVGMLFDPKILVQQPLQVLAVLGIIVVGKSVAATLIVLALRRPLDTALVVSAALAQIGEFSFIFRC